MGEILKFPSVGKVKKLPTKLEVEQMVNQNPESPEATIGGEKLGLIKDQLKKDSSGEKEGIESNKNSGKLSEENKKDQYFMQSSVEGRLKEEEKKEKDLGVLTIEKAKIKKAEEFLREYGNEIKSVIGFLDDDYEDWSTKTERLGIRDMKRVRELLLFLGFIDAQKGDLYEIQMIYPKNAEKEDRGIVVSKMKGDKLQISITGPPRKNKDWKIYNKTLGELKSLEKILIGKELKVSLSSDKDNPKDIIKVLKKLSAFQKKIVAFYVKIRWHDKEFDSSSREKQEKIVNKYKTYIPQCKEMLDIFYKYEEKLVKFSNEIVKIDPLYPDLEYVLGIYGDENEKLRSSIIDITDSIRHFEKSFLDLESRIKSENSATS